MSSTFFAFAPFATRSAAWAASRRSISGSVSPRTDSAPNLTKLRRDRPSHCLAPAPSLISSMLALLPHPVQTNPAANRVQGPLVPTLTIGGMAGNLHIRTLFSCKGDRNFCDCAHHPVRFPRSPLHPGIFLVRFFEGKAAKSWSWHSLCTHGIASVFDKQTNIQKVHTDCPAATHSGKKL